MKQEETDVGDTVLLCVTNREVLKKNRWIFDSGASNHMTPSK